jgi:hypothetical protein
MVMVNLPLLMPTTRLIRSTDSTATALLIHHLEEVLNGDPVGAGIPVDLLLAHNLWLGTTDLMIRANTGLTPLVALVQATGRIVVLREGLDILAAATGLESDRGR